MKRIHLLEIEDQPWCPAALREAVTDYLRFMLNTTRPYQAIVADLVEALKESGSSQVVDLCSGGGGPWPSLLPALVAKFPGLVVSLTDLFPNAAGLRPLKERYPSLLRVHEVPVDATSVPETLRGFRTLFTSFHHFRPEQAKSILEDAVRRGEGIAIFETTERSPAILLFCLLGPLVSLVAMPFVRPLRLRNLALTYLIPAAPFVIGFDGLVSCFRTYEPPELAELSAELRKANPHWIWKIGRKASVGGLAGITYLIAYPRRG